MAGKYKIEVHLKSDKVLVYYPDDADNAWNNWFQYLANSDDGGCVAFGRYIVPKSQVEFVEHHEL